MPKTSGIDVRIARRIARKHGPDLERKRQKLEFIQEAMKAKERRLLKKIDEEERKRQTVMRVLDDSLRRQLEREQMALSAALMDQLHSWREKYVGKRPIGDLLSSQERFVDTLIKVGGIYGKEE